MKKYAVAMVWSEMDAPPIPTLDIVESTTPLLAATIAILPYEPRKDYEDTTYEIKEDTTNECFVLEIDSTPWTYIMVKEVK